MKFDRPSSFGQEWRAIFIYLLSVAKEIRLIGLKELNTDALLFGQALLENEVQRGEERCCLVRRLLRNGEC